MRFIALFIGVICDALRHMSTPFAKLINDLVKVICWIQAVMHTES
jgi:hypothetical protein